MNTQVLNEVKAAYADCWMDDIYGNGMKTRKLMFRASEAVTPQEALTIASVAIPEGYNAFEPELLAKFPADCRIVFAREYSVCLYVKEGPTPLPGMSEIAADEYGDDADGFVRIWWD